MSEIRPGDEVVLIRSPAKSRGTVLEVDSNRALVRLHVPLAAGRDFYILLENLERDPTK